MSGVPDDAVRRWRALRLHLSRPAADTSEAVAASLPFPASPSSYLSLFARVEGFSPRDLDRLVFEGRSLRLFPLHRGGAFLVPFEALSALLGLRRFALASELRRSKVARRRNEELEREASRLLPTLSSRPTGAAALGASAPASVARRALEWLAARGEVVMGCDPPSLFGAPTFALPRAGERVPAAPTEGFAFLQDIALLYVRAAGPATRDDFLWWAGLSRSAARHTIEDLAGLLEEVDLEGERKAHFMLEEDAAELRGNRSPRTTRPALLPACDPAGLASRSGFAPLCEVRLRPALSPGGRAKPKRLALLGGSAVATWAGFSRDLSTDLEFARSLTPEAEAALRGEAERVCAFAKRDLVAVPGAPPLGPALARAL